MYKTSYAEMDLNVERGAQLLDEQRPGWYRTITLDELNMGDSSCCIIGQQFQGNYYSGVSTLSELRRPRERWRWEVEHGFERPSLLFFPTENPDDDVPIPTQDAEYEYLRKQWERQIQDRLILDIP